jgi:hypothetical protein
MKKEHNSLNEKRLPKVVRPAKRIHEFASGAQQPQGARVKIFQNYS